MSQTRSSSGTGRQIALTSLLTGLFVIAPLFRAGQPALAQLVLELLALAVLGTVLWQSHHRRLTRIEWVGVVLLIGLPLLYLIPLPSGLGALLPGREVYQESLSLVGLGHIPVNLSIVPRETEQAVLALMIPIAVFLGTRMIHSERLLALVLLLLGIAALQVILGLMQYGAGKESGLYLGMTFTHFSSAVGTYTNRNHLAGLVEMALPLAVALLMYNMGRAPRDRSQNWRKRFSFLGSMSGNQALIYGALALLLLVGVIFTRSRAGIALTMLGMLLLTFAFARRIGGNNVYGLAGTIVAVGIGLGIVIGLAPVLDRFAELDPMEDLRWTVFSATLDGIGAFFPLGSGPGTYAEVFPAFQPIELGRWFVNYAHNDYLHWLFEAGLAAALILVALLALYVLQWTRLWTRGSWSRLRFIQVAAGIGILLLALHELVDYNLHMPANMIYFAFLMGLFFRPGHDEEAVAETVHRRRNRRTPRMQPGETVVTAAGPAQPAGPHPDQIPNPFLDS